MDSLTGPSVLSLIESLVLALPVLTPSILIHVCRHARVAIVFVWIESLLLDFTSVDSLQFVHAAFRGKILSPLNARFRF